MGAQAVVSKGVVGRDPALVGGEFGDVKVSADVEIIFKKDLPTTVGVTDFEDDVSVAVT